MDMYLAPGLQCISNNIAEERNVPHAHIRFHNMMSLESNVNIIAGIPHAFQAMQIYNIVSATDFICKQVDKVSICYVDNFIFPS